MMPGAQQSLTHHPKLVMDIFPRAFLGMLDGEAMVVMVDGR